jgi:hypothetical protein
MEAEATEGKRVGSRKQNSQSAAKRKMLTMVPA